MNNKRRGQIKSLITSITILKGELELIRDDEQDYLDNMPENLQGGIKYDSAEEAVDNLEEALDLMDDLLNYLEDAKI